jgi:hypothetical protein
MAKKSKNSKDAAASEGELKPGYIRDYISGVPVKATPEEVEAVQVFAQRLVEDYGYPKSHIQTRPQYRVRVRPSDEEKNYPVDRPGRPARRFLVPGRLSGRLGVDVGLARFLSPILPKPRIFPMPCGARERPPFPGTCPAVLVC